MGKMIYHTHMLISSIYPTDDSKSFDYALTEVRQGIGNNVTIARDPMDFCIIKVGGSKNEMDRLKKKLRRLSRGKPGFKIYSSVIVRVYRY